MKYFSQLNHSLIVPAKTNLNFTFTTTYLGKNLTQEFNIFYSTCLNNINSVQVSANNPTFQRLDFKFSSSFRKALNYYLKTQIKEKGLVEAHNASDKLFEAFTPISSILQDNERLFSASLYWRRIFEFINTWEQRNNYLVHKGTIFSFWSLAELLAGDSDVGFMLMRNGLKEDERFHNLSNNTNPLSSPALDFVKLDISNKNSYFRNIVKTMRRPLSNRIRTYNSTFNYHFTMRGFQQLFSSISVLQETSLYFNIAHQRVKRIKLMFKLGLGDNISARHIFLSSLFDISRVAEVVARQANAAQTNPRRFTIRTFLGHLSTSRQWNMDTRTIGDDVDNKFNGSMQDVKDIVTDLLSRNLSIVQNQMFPPVIYDCLLLYGLRNYSAHSIDNVPEVFTREYVDILQRCYNALFFIIENYQTV